MTADDVHAKLDALAPDRTADCRAALELADACYALEAGFSQVLGMPAPDPAVRPALRARALELLRAWIPRIDLETLQALEPRVRDRRMPLDLKARKAELKESKLPDHSRELAAYRELPALPGWEPLAAFYVREWLAIGEHPEEGIVLDAQPGVWLAYARTHETDNDGDNDDAAGPGDEMLAVHAQHLATVDELAGRARRLPDRLSIDAARMAIADEGAVRDPDLVDALWENHEEEYRGYAAQLFVSGDGHAFVNQTTIDGLTVLVRVELY